MSEHDTHFHNTEDDIDNINNGSCARQAPKENDYEQEILEIDYLNIYLFDSRFLTQDPPIFPKMSDPKIPFFGHLPCRIAKNPHFSGLRRMYVPAHSRRLRVQIWYFPGGKRNYRNLPSVGAILVIKH